MIYETMRVPAKPRGGALPTYQRQGKIHAPGAGVNVRMDDSAARIAGTGADAEARALAGLGKAIQGAADVGLKAYDDYQTVKATEGYNAFQQAMNDKLYGENGIFTRQGEAAFGSAEDMERAISETREDVVRQLGLSDVARQKLGKQVFAYGLQFVPKAQKHAADERKKWADGQDQASLELNLEGFLNNPNDTQARLMYLSTMQQSYRQYADRNGLGAEQRELGWKKILSAAYSQLADKYITAGDLNAARKLVADDPLWMEGDQDKIRAKIQARAEALQAEAERRRKQAEEARLDALSAEIWKDTEGLTWEKRRETAVEQIAARTEDPTERRKLLMLFDSDAEFQKIREEARDNRQARTFVEDARKAGLTPTQVMTRLDANPDMTESAKALAWKGFRGEVEENPANRAALVALRVEIDRRMRDGNPVSDDELEAYAFDKGFTNEQIRAAYSYRDGGGKMGKITLSQLQEKWDALDGGKLPKDVDLYRLVENLIPEGQQASPRDIEQLLSNLMMEGEVKGGGWGYGKDKRNYESRLGGDYETWLPSFVSRQDREEGERFLTEKGWPVTEETLRVFAKVRGGMPHNAIRSLGDWPDYAEVQALAPQAAEDVSSLAASPVDSPEPSEATAEQAESVVRPAVGSVYDRAPRYPTGTDIRRAAREHDERWEAVINAPEPLPDALDALPKHASDELYNYVVVFGELPPKDFSASDMKLAVRERLEDDLDTSFWDSRYVRQRRARRLEYLRENLRGDVRHPITGARLKDRQ